MPRASRDFPAHPKPARRQPVHVAPHHVSRITDRLWLAQRGRCFYCDVILNPKRTPGPDFATLDHVQPRILGGVDQRNRVWCCWTCNQIKANRPPSEHELSRCHRLYEAISLASS